MTFSVCTGKMSCAILIGRKTEIKFQLANVIGYSYAPIKRPRPYLLNVMSTLERTEPGKGHANFV